MATKTYEVDPISRIEGHLGVKVTVDDTTGLVTEANAHGNLWRGFENFLIGRRANDAITFTQRICGVCPVPHGTAATFAADSVLGYSSGYATFSSDQAGFSDGVPEAALHVRNTVLAAEFLMSSITHFYHLAAQSYVQGPPVPPWTPYFKDNQYHSALRAPSALPTQNAGVKNPATPLLTAGWNDGYSNNVWSAVITQYVKALRIRRLTFEAGAMFAGRMPMMSNSVAGGTTNTFRTRGDFDAKINAFRNLMNEVATFVVAEYIPLAFALGALYPDFDNEHNTGLTELSSLGDGKGRNFGGGLGNFLAWGGFPQADGSMGLKGGWVVDAAKAGGPAASGKLLEQRAGAVTDEGSLAWAIEEVKSNLQEFISRSRYEDYNNEFGADNAAYPGNVTRTVPDRDNDADGKYSWLKAPRWDGYAMEVGPLARMVVNGMYKVDGSNLISGAYASVYGGSGAGSLNGVDLRVLDRDLVSGLVGSNVHGAITNWVANVKGGLSTMDRLRGRAIESLWMCIFMLGMPSKDANGVVSFAGNGWLDKLQALGGANVPAFHRSATPPTGTVKGFGLVEAPRGALGHFITATSGKINAYQCVVPTTWNASPKNGTDTSANVEANKHLNTGTNRGAMEQAMMSMKFDGTAISTGVGAGMDGANTANGRISGVEVLRVAQSFDPCIACAVH